GLSGSRSRLDNEMILSFEGLVNSFGHPDLGRAEFVVPKSLFQQSTRSKKLVHHRLSVYFRTLVMIKIPTSVMREIYDHMESAYPHECCGLMIGTSSGTERIVHESRRCLNLNTERAHDRYL